ncbi:MAG: helix-turn-helix transcriptional regulator [Maricaulis sp.]|jgi:transcriptional regulator with XRE-family HTH domain|nr:helix-turn-helix transcriptional regulator [Maricaulis sp.]
MTTVSTRGATSVDVHVGARLRVRRSVLDMSQSELGERLGVTFQQVQKYERGSNRIGASRLFNCARVMDVPISYFFEGLDEYGELPSGGDTDHLYDFIASADGIALAQAFQNVTSQDKRRKFIDLLKSMADEDK